MQIPGHSELKLNQVPAPNHLHGRIDDINSRLVTLRNRFESTLNEVRSLRGGEEGQAGSEPKAISNAIQDKLADTSRLVLELERLAEEFIDTVGSQGYKEPMKAAQLR